MPQQSKLPMPRMEGPGVVLYAHTAKTLDKVDGAPTLKRQQALVARVFGPVATTLAVPTLAVKKRARGAPAQQARFCGACGRRREELSWTCCPSRGRAY